MKHLMFWGLTFAAFHISDSQIDSQPPDFCNLLVDPGTGPQYISLMHYDKATDKCLPFFYFGEGGNGNRFQNERECIRNCSINKDLTYPTEASKICLLKHAKGGCGNNHLRYYYDPQHDKCKKFLWSGCFGNANRFFDQESCNRTCLNIHEDGNEDEEFEPDTPIAIICGVLLATIASSIFITVIVLTLKSKKKKKAQGTKKDPRSDAPLREQTIEMEQTQ